MRLSRLLVIFVTLLTFSNTKLLSQFNTSLIAPVYSLDSLQGFDQNLANAQALGEGFYGQAYTDAIKIYKRNFVINKYDLYKTLNNPASLSGSNSKYGFATVANAPCSNEDFEAGNLSGWTASVGINTNSQNYPTVTGPASASQASVMTTNITDPYVGTIPASPLGGSNVVRINNNVSGDFSVVKLSQTFPVTSNNYFFDFAYWAVMQDAGSSGVVHTCTNTPFMLIKIRDNSNILQALCPTFSIVAPASGSLGCPGLGPLTWTTVGSGVNTIKTSTGWQKFSIDLTPYLFNVPGNVTIEVFVGDCSLGGHWGYAYFDARCNTMDLGVNTQTLSLLSPTIYPQVQCGGTATMTAPAGLINYTWTGPPAAGIGTVTTQTLVTAVPGNYSLVMNPPGICNPISKIINLQFVPPTTVTASPANLCTSGSNTVSTLSASGASQYTWMPGGSNSSSIVVTPTTTSIYTLTARTGTCLGIYTLQVTVNPDPVINVLTSNTSLCPGQTATMTAFGANTYVWNPGALSGSIVTISQSAATTYTTIGTSTAGCTGSVTTTINQTPSPTVAIFVFSPASALTSSVCSGTPVSMFATGGTFTWQPGNVVSNFPTFTPTVSTTYTAIGANGSCTAQAVQSISVDPGPGIALTVNPSSTCPGNTTTLSAVAPAAVGSFTWNPGSINSTSIVVTPTLAGGYSVSARNSAGCVNTQTINPTISPVPTISVSPSSASVCSGSSTTLTASGGVNYTWMPGGLTGATAVLSPTITTTYTVIGANGAGCVNQTTVAVTVVSSPVINATASPTAVCAGSCATITPNGASSYTISGGSFVVCPTSNTVYSIVGSNAAGCLSSPVNISVNVNSSPVINATANPTSICAGNNTTLTANGTVSYTWSTGATGANITVAPVSSQNYTVAGTSAFGCIGQAVVNVVVNSVPNVSVSPSSATICPGGTVSPLANGATSYTWFPGGVTGNNPTFTPAVNTTYTVIGASGTCTNQSSFVVAIAPLPVITATFLPGTICAGSCATLSATGGTSYVMTGITGSPACPLVTTNYTVIGTSVFGCTNSATGTLFVTPAPAITASASPAGICPGGSSNLSATGGVSYTWQPGGMTGSFATVSPTITTIYTVTGTSASGCTATATTTVTVNPAPSVSISPSSTTICQGNSVSLTASGAATYTWLPGNLSVSSVLVNPLVNTTYTVLGSNGSCIGQNTVAVTVAPLPTVNASFNPPTICAGSCATLMPSGAVSYTVNGLSSIACPTITSSYTVIGASAAGCTASTTGTLFVTPAPAITASSSPASVCPGGSSNLSATGGVSYTWQPGGMTGSSANVSPAITTIYTVTGASASGCTATATTTVTVNSVPVISITPSSTTICQGNSANLTAGGATTYTWLPGNLSGSSVVVNPTITTTYTVLGSNGSCSGQNTVAVTVAPPPVINASFNPPTICAGSCATLMPSGAVSYTVNGLSSIACPTITSSYTVIGASAAGCTASTTGTLFVTPAPVITASASPATICSGSSSNLSATGGVSYTWQPGGMTGSSATVSPLNTTIYTVTGTSASGCTGSSTISVNVLTSPTVFAIASPTSICAGGNATLTGGGASLLSWSPGGLSGAVVFVTPTVTTIYTLTGTQAPCTGTTTVTVLVNPTPTVNINASATSICPGGSVTLSATGANSYTWSDGSTSGTRVVSPSVTTTYSVTGTGVTGCMGNSASITITVTNAPIINIVASPTNICIGGNSTLTANGASNYTWQPGNLSGNSVVVAPGVSTNYTVTGSGPGGCLGTGNIFLSVSPGINVSATASPSNVCGSGITTTLSATGATNYTWMPGSHIGSTVAVIVSGSTVYTVTGSNGACSNQATVAVNVVPSPTINITASSTSVCAGGCATLTANGAANYNWSNGTFGASIVVCPTVTTTYSVLGTVGTCTAIQAITIVVSGTPTLSIQSSANPICAGSSAVLTGSGATNYLWSTMSGLSSITVAPPTTSVYTLFGAIGSCTSSVSFTLNVIPANTISIVATSPTICAGFTVGLLASGSPSSYTWQPNNISVNPLVDAPLGTTVYTVSSNNGGCTSTATIAVIVAPLPTVSVIANPQTICTGNSTTLTANGASTYSWIPSMVGGNIFVDSPGSNTTYTVVGFNSFGCPNYTTITVNVIPGISLIPSATSTSICNGSTTTLTASGATNYTWMPGSMTGGTIAVSPSSNTTYTVMGDNGGSCSGAASIAIQVNPNPVISAVASPTFVCAGGTVSLTANGAVNYTWIPGGLIGSSVVGNPATSTNYTVFGVDANGCSGLGAVSVSVNPMSNIVLAANPASLCLGGSSTLTASGGLSYTWNPGAQVTSSLVVTPTITTTYTVLADDASGCTGTFTLPVTVHQTPTLSISPVNFSICMGSSVSLTATGANNYTWLPGGANSATLITSPISATTYTVIGDNGGLCFASATVDVFVNPLPSGVAAASHGTIGCNTPTAQLVGTCTDTNVSYAWAGPSGYSSNIQNPVVSGIWGNFTLSVTDNVTGCVATATVDVATDNTIPLVTAVSSGSIGCAVTSVTLNAINTTTNPGYSWTGPSGFTSIVQSPTASALGTYTIVVTDLTSSCTGSAVVTVGTHTTVSITASIAPSTCDTNGVSNNDGRISVSGFTLTDKYDLVSGTSYTGSATYLTAANIPTNGIIASNLANPTVVLAFTIRLFDIQGCTKDTTLYLIPVDCAFRTLGVAKAVSVPEINQDGSYNLTYTVVAKSYDKGILTGISLTENLSNTFPAPTTFTVIADSLKTIGGTPLDLNMSFNGSSQTNLLTGSSTNSLSSKDSTVIQFKLKVKPNLFLTDYKNSVLGTATTDQNVTMTDSSNTGLNPNPDGDKNPYNNNIPTSISFTPNLFFGLTKVGEIHKSESGGFDVTYTITVHNLGNDTLYNISIKDSLFENTIKHPATYSMRSGPVSNGDLVVDPTYDGNTRSYLLDSTRSKIPPNTTRLVYFTINVIPGEVASISNSASGTAKALIPQPRHLKDVSNAGTNPDLNSNGIWDESSDNVPTELLIPNTHTLFIPEGFSPDGDNINQYFVIQGLPTTGNNVITIFNRWGNKVYYSANYDNTWDGTPNVSGTLGKNKLPQGTYYYILEMKGSGQKPITGFVVLQY